MVKTTCRSAQQYLDALGSLLTRIDAASIDRVTDAVFKRWLEDRQVLVLGNGGSASTAGHYVTDLVKTAWVPGQRRLRALSMTYNPGLTTAIGNDLSYDESFSFPLESYAREGDLVIAISGSGNSPNIVRACRLSKERGLEIAGLTGFDGGELGRLSDRHVNVPSDNYGLVEDLHLSMGHMIGQGLRSKVDRHVAGG